MQYNIIKKGLILAVMTLLIGVAIAPITVSNEKNLSTFGNINRDDWWDEDWEYRKEIVINHNLIDGTLQYFPVLIHNTSSDFIAHAQADGDDFVFTSDDNSEKYNHEIDFYNDSSGELVCWVNIPGVSSTVDTFFYLYYGNPNCENQENPEMVWDPYYSVVHHMDDATPDIIFDSTSNSNTGYKYMANDPMESENGIVGKCQKNNTDNNYITMDHDSSLNIGTGDATIEIWLRTTSYASEALFFSDDSDDYNKVHFTKNHFVNNVADIFVRGNTWSKTSSIKGSTVLNDDEWHYIVATIDNSEAGYIDDLRLFVDGEEENPTEEHHDWDGSTLSNNQVKWIGMRKNDNKSFEGYLDEFRLALYELSDAWIKASYQNVIDILNFLDIGTEEDQNYNHAPKLPSNPIPENGTIDVALDTVISWTCSDPDGDAIVYDVYFGNTTPLPLVSNNHSETTFDPDVLQLCTIYYWQIVAKDVYGASTEGPIWNFKTRCPGAPSIPDIDGPSTGNPETTYTYTFVSADPDGDDVYYEIDWGDETVDLWDGPHNSNTVITRNHSWDSQGTFTIKARAKDEFDAVGEWGTYSVIMPRHKTGYNSLLLVFFDHFPLLERLMNLIWK